MSFYCLPRLRTWSHLAWSIRSPTNSPSPLHSKSLPTSKSWPRTPPGTERKPSLSHAGEEERNGKRGEAGKGGKEEYEIYMRRGEGGKGGEVRRECERHEKRGGKGGKEGVWESVRDMGRGEGRKGEEGDVCNLWYVNMDHILPPSSFTTTSWVSRDESWIPVSSIVAICAGGSWEATGKKSGYDKLWWPSLLLQLSNPKKFYHEVPHPAHFLNLRTLSPSLQIEETCMHEQQLQFPRKLTHNTLALINICKIFINAISLLMYLTPNFCIMALGLSPLQVTKEFSKWKQVHVGMEPSKTSQTRWKTTPQHILHHPYILFLLLFFIFFRNSKREEGEDAWSVKNELCGSQRTKNHHKFKCFQMKL